MDSAWVGIKPASAARCLLLISVLILLVTGCGGGSDATASVGRKKIAMVVKMNQGEYWGTVQMGAEVAAKEFGVDLRFTAPPLETDVRGQIRL
ncbi:hypothetical protein K0U00_48520, partial [Paenibacillus sepulcri]|nr:hypothetical protein [Paenibacillus sepulcri]